MKRKVFTTIVLISCFMVCLAAVVDLSGKWSGTIKTPDGNEVQLNYTFKVDGDKLTGLAESQGNEVTIDSGKISGNDIKFTITNIDGVTIPHSGKYYGDSISMNLDYQGMKFHTTLKRADK